MKQAVMYGGGNIGRGFIGATLSQSGYKVTFIDVAEPVVKALQEKEQYPVRYVSSEGHEDVVIEHVTAVNGNDQEAASEAIANCDIMATAGRRENSQVHRRQHRRGSQKALGTGRPPAQHHHLRKPDGRKQGHGRDAEGPADRRGKEAL